MSEERILFPLQRDSVLDEIDPASARETLEDQPLLIPIGKASRLLGISKSSAYRWAAEGELPCRHLGGRVYIVTAKLRELLEIA